jgi:membrane associated rhomboid family serine protease
MTRLTKLPVLSGTIFAITAVMNAIQFARPGTLHQLRRQPEGMHGEWWRTFTSLFVQDGGVYGTLSNLAFLLALGVVAEQVLSRPRWLVSYFGIGLIGEMFGYLWQPVGGGNSVAICGLAGAVAVAITRRDERLPAFAPAALVMWLGVLLATWVFPLIAVGMVGVRLVQAVDRDRIARLMPIAATVVGGVLCSVQNIHGGALLAGLAVAVAMTAGRPYGVISGTNSASAASTLD